MLSAIFTLEWLNCLMFTQSTSPFIQNCLTMCLVPMTIICITELQFCAYLQILRYRISLINNILKLCAENNRDQKGKRSQIKTKWNLHKGNKLVHSKVDECNTVLTTNVETRIYSNIKMMVVVGCRVALCIYNSNSKNPLSIKDGIKLPRIISIAHVIYHKLNDFGRLINYSYGIQLVVILTIKFTTLTSLLYFCGMFIIK